MWGTSIVTIQHHTPIIETNGEEMRERDFKLNISLWVVLQWSQRIHPLGKLTHMKAAYIPSDPSYLQPAPSQSAKKSQKALEDREECFATVSWPHDSKWGSRKLGECLRYSVQPSLSTRGYMPRNFCAMSRAFVGLCRDELWAQLAILKKPLNSLEMNRKCQRDNRCWKAYPLFAPRLHNVAAKCFIYCPSYRRPILFHRCLLPTALRTPAKLIRARHIKPSETTLMLPNEHLRGHW